MSEMVALTMSASAVAPVGARSVQVPRKSVRASGAAARGAAAAAAAFPMGFAGSSTGFQGQALSVGRARGASAAGALRRRASPGTASRVACEASHKVAVLGAGGGIGQPLSMLLKMSPLISELALYDLRGTPGVAADLSHMEFPAKVTGYTGPEELAAALEGCSLVVIPAGVPRKPGMTRDDLFNINAGIVKALCEASAKTCPKALVNIISNPVNSTVPIAAEVYKKAGVYDPKRIFGVTTLDVVRSNTFVAEKAGLDVSVVNVPVVGGHAGATILPLLSQTEPATGFDAATIEALTTRIQNAGTEVVEAKAGAGSATLSMAYAAARFAESCLRGLNGENVVECSYVASDVTDLPFFATKVKLGKEGAVEVHGLGDLTDFEKAGVEAMKAELKGSIEKGIAFANQ